MAATLTISPRELRYLSRPRSSGADAIRAAAASLVRLTNMVQQRWSELTDDERTLLRGFAYSMIDPPRLGWLSRVRAWIVLYGLYAQGNFEALSSYLSALDGLIDAILSAIEREHPHYLASLREALADESPTAFADAADFRAWLDSVSSKALQ